jgi:hypothetical protein
VSRPIEKLEAALSARGLQSKRVSGWMRCPHPCSPSGDTRNSFAYLEQADGTLFIASHKPSYTSDDCLRALGLTMADLFADGDERYKGSTKYVHGYEYASQDGSPSGRVTRTKDKNFLQGKYEKGEFKPKLEGHVLPLYLAPMLRTWINEGNQIYITEGEKDARCLCINGQPATTKPGGAKSPWQECHVNLLADADIVIVADKDEAGRQAAVDAYEVLFPVAKSIKIVESKGKKDAFDHFEEGYKLAEFLDASRLIPLITEKGKRVSCIDWQEIEETPAPKGVPSGFRQIDMGVESRGFPKGQMTIWGARKKVGKTAGMVQSAVAALEEWMKVLYVCVTADLTPGQVRRRIYRQVTGVKDVPENLELSEQWHREIENRKEFWTLKFATSKDFGSDDIDDLVPGIETLNRVHEFDIVFVDYAQKISCKRERERVREMERVSDELAKMASRNGFALVVGSQLSEEGRTRYSQEFEDDCGLMIVVSAPDGIGTRGRRFEVPLSRFGPSGWGFDATWEEDRLNFKENRS